MLRAFFILLMLSAPALAQAPEDTARLILLQQQLSLAKTNYALAQRSWDGIVNSGTTPQSMPSGFPKVLPGSSLLRGPTDWPLALATLDAISVKLYAQPLALDQSPQLPTTAPKIIALISRIETEIKSIEARR